ncbi:MAG: PorP/SprF family type IX secretion system membrane protein [Bacteroidota bacterium]
MKTTIKTCFLLVCLIFATGILNAQDANFSMFYNNPTYYNPGMTAIGNGFTFRANARSLWTPIPSKFNTVSVSLEAEAINKIGFGLQAYSDVGGEGHLRTTGANLSYMYRPLESKNALLQIGFSGGLVNKFVDWSQFTFSDQLDEVQGVVRESAFSEPNFRSVSYADFSAGAAFKFNTKKRKSGGMNRKMTGTLGAGFHHLTQPKDAFLGDKEKLPIKSVVHGNISFLIDKVIFSPAFIYERQNQFQTFTIGLNIVKKPFYAGLWLRNRTYAMLPKRYDSFIVSVGAHIPHKKLTNYRIGYSFDMTLSRLKSASIGTHEVSLIIDYDNRVLFQKIKNKKSLRNKYKCPEDFKGFD